MTNAKAFREVLSRVDRVARRHIAGFEQKKIGAYNRIAEEANFDATDRKILARYVRQTFHRARQLRDGYDLSNRTEHAIVWIGFIIGAPIGFAVGLVFGVQYIGLLAAFFGVAIAAVVAILLPFLVYYLVAYLLVWKNLASERKKFLEGLEGV